MNSKPDPCCDCPRFKTGRGFVPPDGPLDAKLIIIGEQPGDQEVREGKPFVGPSGEALEKALRRAGLSRGEVLITNVRWCGPPSEGEPPKIRQASIEYCRQVHLQNLLDSLKEPVHISLVGADAAESFTGFGSTIKGHGSVWAAEEITSEDRA